MKANISGGGGLSKPERYIIDITEILKKKVDELTGTLT